MRTVAILAAAGAGRRLGLKAKKAFVSLNGRPLVTYALNTLERSKVIDAIVVGVGRDSLKRFKDLAVKFRFKKIIAIVVGGKTRFESVRNCLKKIGHEFDIVLVHDAARPFLDKALIEESIRLAARFGGCVSGVPESDTVKLVSESLFIEKTLDRNKIFRAQTPQAFRYELIKKAYRASVKDDVTDDSSLLERLGKRVKVLKGSYRNIKITTKEDLKIAEALLC